MRVHTYRVDHDLGFAPNPFFGACTLACCKPYIRKRAVEGDYVLGLGSAKLGLNGRLIYWMRVDEISDFDSYFLDQRFQKKKPNLLSAKRRRYGDNIYFTGEDGNLTQLDSFHCHPDPSETEITIQNDTGHTKSMLIGWHFGYYGDKAIEIPFEFEDLHDTSIREKYKFEPETAHAIVRWVQTLRTGRHGRPVTWKKLGIT